MALGIVSLAALSEQAPAFTLDFLSGLSFL